MEQLPLLPITPNKNIFSTYVDIEPQDFFYTNLKTKKLVTLNKTHYTWDGPEYRYETYQASSSISTAYPATESGPRLALSSCWLYVNNLLYINGKESSSKSLSAYYSTASSFNKFLVFNRKYCGDEIITDTLSATGTTVGTGVLIEYHSDSLGNVIATKSGNIVGQFLSNEALISVTGIKSSDSERSTLISAGVGTTYKFYTNVYQNTMNVFCRCQPDELNYTLNPTAFKPDKVEDWMNSSFTSSTDNAEYRSDFTSSGMNWQPYITSIGLYDDNNDLLAIAKLTRPLRKSSDIPMTFQIRIDI